MTLKSFPPQVFLLGAQKAGTTQLASYLEQHTDITLSNPKEPDFYTKRWDTGLIWYRDRFDNLNKILIDASTSYSCAPLPEYFESDKNAKSAYNGIPQRIKATVPDAKFIYIMRDPVKRAYSAYLHQVRAGLEPRPLGQAIQRSTYYLRTGHYAGQIELYLNHFSIEQFKFVFFEDFIADPQAVVKDCFDFIGVDSSISLSSNVSRNESFVYKGKWDRLNIMLRKKGGVNKIVKTLKPLIPKNLLNKAANVMTQKPEEISEIDKQWLASFYIQPNHLLKNLINVSKFPWEQ